MKQFVIAGGTSGIGLSLATQLAEAGHQVLVLARDQRALPHHPNITFESTDFTASPLSLPTLPESINGLVYCPGSIQLAPFNRLGETAFLNDFRINVLGAVGLVQAALPALKKSGNASVVLFSTVAVQTGMPYHASIAASKGAIEGLTRSLAAEYAANHIRVNAIAPSLTDTPLAEKLLSTPEKREASNKRHPLGRVGSADELAGLAAFLLSDQASWMTGQILHADGGMGNLKLVG